METALLQLQEAMLETTTVPSVNGKHVDGERPHSERPPLQIWVAAGGNRTSWTLPPEQVWRRGVARRARAALAPHFGGAPYGAGWAVFADGRRKLVPLTDSSLKEAHFRGWRLEARRTP